MSAFYESDDRPPSPYAFGERLNKALRDALGVKA